jgi:TPR repeat protein
MIRLLMLVLALTPGLTHADDVADGFGAYKAKDYATALKSFQRAALQGDARAQYNLGQMYSQGQGAPQDDAEAVKCYRLAALQGHVDAQINLGSMYARGQGVLLDKVRAYMWFDIAAASGNARATMNRDIAARKITAAQIAEARKMARDCQARHLKDCN